ncbi:Gfo/Idh/MocA family protein [Halopelagius longus]|uniref:Gfo/Idh/MocA family oxidoreductase n=1 Tax=Halopelagius longus TaxID=1236180 RepID=A0A1H1G1T3_9EURY|nr:Gfo/Idh/MocA family oxidoreductase [Halopelagius longus]RDI69899.1 gfo/Idh/MocA family oxidoreductase [Halopelagius longus]SDR07045.1 Predicted dehydrogenase [Halopelagius longus]
MNGYTVAVVGTGPDPSNPTVEGFAMGYRHAEAYATDDRCELVACADIVRENAEAFAATFGVPETGVYEDYERMLSEAEPDVVSVCVPPAIHRDVVVDCARSGVVSAVHCEKPMADSLADAREMVRECRECDVQLTFNRQRRFGAPFTEAKRLLDDGRIGDLTRIEIGWGDFYDTGAHTVDLAGMFNDEHPAEWVIAALDYREEDVRFGSHQENQMWAQWRYENGVYGVLSSGEGSDFTDAAFLLRGTEGVVRINVEGGPMLELERGGERSPVDVGTETMHRTGTETDRFGSHYHDRAIAEVFDALEEGREPTLSGRLGLNTAEILFAGYESVRRRGRVDLPFDADDHPFEAMVESGELAPEPSND